MKSRKELDQFIRGDLKEDLERMTKRREKIRPHYGRFSKRVLLIGAILLIAEILFWVLVAGWRGILFTPMIVAVLLLFGNLFKGIRFAVALSKFQAEFLEVIGTRVASFLLPNFTYTPFYEPDWDVLKGSDIFAERAGIAEGSSHFQGEIDGVPVEFFHLDVEYIPNKYRSFGEPDHTAQSRGLFFVAHIGREQPGNVIVRRRPRKGKGMREMERLGNLITASNRSIFTFFSEAYEFFTAEEEVTEEALPPEAVERMNAFAENFKFPVTFALANGNFYYFIESESFFFLDANEINTDTSFTTILHRHQKDVELAMESFEILKPQELR